MRTPDDLPGLLAQHRRDLAADPSNLSARYLLANCLYISGERTQAEAEWETVAAADGSWAELVAEARLAAAALGPRPGAV